MSVGGLEGWVWGVEIWGVDGVDGVDQSTVQSGLYATIPPEKKKFHFDKKKTLTQ